ncbi:helix-turn-helix domain-containing protein [Kitasatospora sp. HPMI-4]|uniref:helix-turn-helix domain-containing protein n=1 Tax=Kitasatospora sp. HPMI-4 TaxID=3448443 RepID=UPI003F1CDB88
MTQLINASERTWVELLTGLTEEDFEELLETLRSRAETDGPRAGRRWTLSLENRVLLVTTYWRTQLTMREVATVFGVSKSAADRIVGHLGAHLELSSPGRRRCRLSLRCDRNEAEGPSSVPAQRS